MVFSSYAFIFIFFPIVFAGYRICLKAAGINTAKIWLVGASLIFYANGKAALSLLLLGTMLFNYAVVFFLSKVGKKGRAAKLLLTASLAEGLGLLFYFKYTNFFLQNINLLFGTELGFLEIVLPLGISFYTFQILSYVVEVYRGNSEKNTLLNFAVFVTFFPQLIVGPIIRHDDMSPQLSVNNLNKTDSRNIMLGMLLFSIGCAKKIILADPLIDHARNFYDVMGGGNFFEAWGGAISYTFAYYFDFSGYIDMAIGLGLFFNIKLPVNFDSPYKARNFADFWRRWNITVSQFFNDYIFKNIFHFGDRLPKLILATMVTFVASGLWHGAGWHFIFWGIANGILVCMANIMTLKRKKLPFFLAWALTFLGAVLVRVLFDSNSMSQALEVYKSLINIGQFIQNPGVFLSEGSAYVTGNIEVVVISIISALICFFAKNTRELSESFTPKWYYAAASGVLLAASVFFMGRVSSFLYFQF